MGKAENLRKQQSERAFAHRNGSLKHTPQKPTEINNKIKGGIQRKL